MINKTNKFITKSRLLHGDKYDYSKVEYVNARDKVTIICPEHGEFEQAGRVHLRGSGCKKCKSDGRRLVLGDIISRGREIHGDKYDYSKVKYINSKTKVTIICPEHGEFEQSVDAHLSGKGCGFCVGNYKLDNILFVEKAKLIHGNKYDYSKVNYINNSTKVTIICPEHGEFGQTPNNHTSNKQGCRKCYYKGIADTTSTFILSGVNSHGDKYDYSKVNYINSKSKVTIICPEHGEFEQIPESHIRGYGCLKCSHDTNRKTNIEFINDILKIHGDKYDYSKVNYVRYDDKVTIICSEHGEFEVYPKHILTGQGCRKCNSSTSNQEKSLVKFISTLNLKIKENDRVILEGKELDIYIPSHNLAIEYNGLYWHSERFVDKDYHLNKTQMCEDKDIQLIHIFEDEWLYKQDIVKSILRNKLGLTENKVYGRKTIIKEVNTKESKVFLNDNHIQGYTNSSIKLGLYHNDELVSLMTFGKPRLGIGGSYDGYELSRFCNKLNTSVIGGASKLLKYFIKTYELKEIRSYASRVISHGNLYKTLGFELSHINKPNYWYIINQERKHRFNFRKEKLKNSGFDINDKTEHQIMLDRGVYRIYDCGTLSYKLIIK